MIFSLLFCLMLTIHFKSQTTTTILPETTSTDRISVRKCNEYKEFVYDKLYIANGLENPPIIRKVENCAFTSIALIVGGTAAKQMEFPHMALIGYDDEDDDDDVRWSCGGTLISELFVLSAAHCSDIPQVGLAKYVRLGEHNQNRTNDGMTIDFNITKIVSHPKYRPKSHYHDIALFKLNKKVEFNPAIRPACLPEQSIVPTKTAIASGWGRVMWAAESRTKLLMKVNLEIFPQNECNSTISRALSRLGIQNFAKLSNGLDEEIQLCAGSHTGAKDTCQGDSGGPLQIYHNTHNCTYIIVGVTSFGIGCGIVGVPAIYTRVYGYLDWIEDIVWPDE